MISISRHVKQTNKQTDRQTDTSGTVHALGYMHLSKLLNMDAPEVHAPEVHKLLYMGAPEVHAPEVHVPGVHAPEKITIYGRP